MRLKIAGVLLIAGTVVGCASNTPAPPPPMAAAPEPAPAPAPPPMAAPASGTYRGTAELTSDQRGCRPLHGSYTARVRNNTITLAGVRGKIGPDGTISGGGLSGTVNGGTADVTVTRGRCTYHYTLNNG
jgi:pyruvate/2-oxoglutarate dehydrogenase complex dihydrolipoamide acyltransferase (E2) component